MAKLTFFYSSMNSGKSSHLLQLAYNYEENNLKPFVIKPEIDKKGDNKIVSRIGLEREVDALLSKDADVLDVIPEQCDVIVVDEAQFLTTLQVDTLYWVSKMNNIPVICYGLRTDFQMNGFEGSTRLLEIADNLEEMKTLCAHCGAHMATNNLRLINGKPTFHGDQVAIDGIDAEYKPVCGECMIKLMEETDE